MQTANYIRIVVITVISDLGLIRHWKLASIKYLHDCIQCNRGQILLNLLSGYGLEIVQTRARVAKCYPKVFYFEIDTYGYRTLSTQIHIILQTIIISNSICNYSTRARCNFLVLSADWPQTNLSSDSDISYNMKLCYKVFLQLWARFEFVVTASLLFTYKYNPQYVPTNITSSNN